MSRRFAKLVTLLRELFQLDQPDLDFGFYRIMHAKSAEVTQFLVEGSVVAGEGGVRRVQARRQAALEKELAQAVEQAQGLGVDPETTQKVKDLRKRLAEEAVDLGALEAEVYDHLYRFFRRHYTEGDFLSKRVYKAGVNSRRLAALPGRWPPAAGSLEPIRPAQSTRCGRLRGGTSKSTLRCTFRSRSWRRCPRSYPFRTCGKMQPLFSNA